METDKAQLRVDNAEVLLLKEFPSLANANFSFNPLPEYSEESFVFTMTTLHLDLHCSFTKAWNLRALSPAFDFCVERQPTLAAAIAAIRQAKAQHLKALEVLG
jgi:hypothetical protein